MGHAFDSVALAVSPVVCRVDSPSVARSVVRLPPDAVHHRITHLHILVLHIYAGTQDTAALIEFTRAHPPKEVQVLDCRARAKRAFKARLPETSSLLGDDVGTLVIYIGEVLRDEKLCPLVKLLEVIRAMKDRVGIKTKPR